MPSASPALNQLLDALYAASPSGMAFADVEGLLIQVNAAFLRLWRLPDAASAIGRRATEFCADPTEAGRIIGRVLETGAWAGEMQARDGEGRTFVVQATVHRVAPQGDHPGGVLASFVDIDAAYQARKSLEARQVQVNLLLESTAEAIYGSDRNGICTFVNQACLNVLGYEREEDLVGKHIHSLIHHHHGDGREYAACDCRAYAAYVQNAPMHVDDEVFWRRDGTSFPVEYWSRPMLQDGKPIGAVVAFFDISARLADELRLRQAAAVMDNTLEGVLITDPEGQIIAVNRAFTRITGYSEAEALGRTPRMLRSEHHPPEFYADMWSALKNEGTWQGEVWNRRKSGEVYAQLLSISAVRDQAERTVNFAAIFSDITRIKQFEARLEHMAHYDPLTELPNRLLLQSRLEHAIRKSHRHREGLAVLFFDLDRFKIVNDTLGHPAGDALLQAFAQRVSKRLREGDTLARLGGDEFVVLLEELKSPKDAASVAEDILKLAHQPFLLPGGHEVYVGASIGISLYPEDGETPEALVKNADAAMYLSKEHGRGTYRFYTAELLESANDRLTLETRLRQALERDEFELEYQPLCDPAGQIIGVEALVRWHLPEAGLVSPGCFIPAAEETGLIVPIGEWVLETACRQAAAWHAEGHGDLMLAVNISPRQFLQPDLVKQVRDILERTGMRADRLELEITEGAMMTRGDHAMQTLEGLKGLGLDIAIDDFGTGYSSLAYLKRFPVEKLKIDQSFVRDIPRDQNDMEIAATIIAMGHNLRLKVLAEGVETPDQLAFMRDKGCDLYQGYLLGRPMSAAKLGALLAQRQPLVPESNPDAVA